MRGKYKVLHLASFSGNIGDEANHNGFRRMLQKNLNIEVEYTDLEIRNFYKSWSKMKFDDNFVELCNKHDFIIIGGGNFCELCWDYSKTGTTLDIGLDILEKINPPILINAIGVDDGKGINDDNINKFKKFLDYMLGKEKYIFSVRNDGSMKILDKYFSDCKLERVYVVPDGGFFIEPGNYSHIELNGNSINIGINLAGDMEDIRFANESQIFCQQFGNYVNYILSLNSEINIVFIPHMYKDIEIISNVLNFIRDDYRRNRISVAPLLNGTLNGGDYIFSLYKKLDFALGMRFHSNVCAIGLNVPNIGLITYHKHGYLFDEINLPDRALNVKEEGFFDKLTYKTIEDLGRLYEIRENYKKINEKLEKDIYEFHLKVKQWLTENKVI